jgi:hypothetical protein
MNHSHEVHGQDFSKSEQGSSAQVEADLQNVLDELRESNLLYEYSLSQKLEIDEEDICVIDGGVSEDNPCQIEYQKHSNASSIDIKAIQELEEEDLIMACLSDDDSQRINKSYIQKPASRTIRYKSVDSVVEQQSTRNTMESKIKTTES